MKIVLDTNIFVAAGFNPHSSSAAIIQALKTGMHTLVWNAQTKRETKKILDQIPPLAWSRFNHLFAPDDEFTEPTQPERYTQVSDFDDRKFAALAAAADAVLVTNDDHLLSVREQIGVTVLTPTEFASQHHLT